MFIRIFTLTIVTALILSPANSIAEEIRDYEMPVVVDTPLEQPSAPDESGQETVAVVIPTDVDLPADEPVNTDSPAGAVLDNDYDALLRAQKRLITLGYLRGTADGIYGPMTAAALQSFQDANELPATGHLDSQTQSLLDQLVASSASNADVQQRLIDLGYLQGTADGKWGPRSTTAMRSFQELNSLPVTGTADDTSTAALFSDNVVTLPTTTLAIGSKGDDVVALQQKLIQYGFLAGKADGAYGNQTSKAVKAFQEHLVDQGYNLSTDGTTSPVTLHYLNQSKLTTYISTVSLGSAGPEAKRVETRLASLGYMDATPDDEFDDYAVEALQLFQQKANITATGVADRKTCDILFSSTAPATDRCVLHGISKGDSGLVVQYVQQALFTGGMAAIMPNGKYGSDEQDAIARLYEYVEETEPSAAPLFADSTNLSKEVVTVLLDGVLGPNGAGNAAEKTRIQRRLHSLYYLGKYDIDGKFGGGTQSALQAFQSTNGLPETGEADSATLSLLFSDNAIPKQLPYRVEVSIDRQTVQVYHLNDQGSYDLEQTFTCSTGLGNSTPRGIFLDGYPANRWHYFKKFECWAQYSFEIEGNILFHSVLYSDKDTSTLRKGSVYALGSKASHGCIRLSVKNAKWLFEHCKKGSLVIVIR